MPYSFRWIKKVPDVHGIDKNFDIALCMYKEGKKQKGGCKLVIQTAPCRVFKRFFSIQNWPYFVASIQEFRRKG